MFSIRTWISWALVSSFVNGKLSAEQVAFMAVDYMEKGILHPADMEHIHNATNPSKEPIEEPATV